MNKITPEQSAAIGSRGQVIVSASAGSGKTFVMIEKLVNAIAGGADLDSVLAVTFTKKAAAQMKEKLRKALIERMNGADGKLKSHLKVQLNKIPAANISTIHSLCATFLRTYFYAVGIDGSFDIIASDDSVANDLKRDALDDLFERYYAEDNADFKLLLGCYLKKRSDSFLRKCINEAYDKVRAVAHYKNLLEATPETYTEKGFQEVVKERNKIIENRVKSTIYAVQLFENDFFVTEKREVYNKIFEEMKESLQSVADGGIFAEKRPFTTTKRPKACDADKEAAAAFSSFRDSVKKRYDNLCGDMADEKTEREAFFKSGEVAMAFSHVLLQFDREYALVKREENKLDYNDLEHLLLELLQDESIRKEIESKYKYVFVDEYQDVNPVQEEIITSLGGEVFLVGDVKQAIYGFRGSKSLFFADKYESFKNGKGTALRLTSNFRSSDGVLNFCNKLFSFAMCEEICGYNYNPNSIMRRGGKYPEGYGEAKIHIFGSREETLPEWSVYSVQSSGRQLRHTREGLAVLSIVEKELSGKHYDIEKGDFVDTQPGDICILTRKNKGDSTEGIIRALRDEGYSVTGAQETLLCDLPEVKQFWDILSLIDNAEQDIPLVTALLSPLGGFNEDELAYIRIAANDRYKPFRECCKGYRMGGETGKKLTAFYNKLKKLRALSEILTTGGLADEILETYGLEISYGAAGDNAIKNVLRFIDEGADLPLSSFLRKIKAGAGDIKAPSSAASDSIKVMSMHSAKGLEFPVVIIADICRTFKGMDYEEIPFDEQFGFAPKCFDRENMLANKTILRNLAKTRVKLDELKNELNLFYVACTRAMCNLHILAEEIKPYDRAAALDARCYADLFDLSQFNPEEIDLHEEFSAEDVSETVFYKPDPDTVAVIEKSFSFEYPHGESVNLPVKSSASAILKSRDTEPYFVPHTLFGGEGETGTERGSAYHRFLELCDFGVKDIAGVEREIENFVQSGRMTAEQKELINAQQISEILHMPVFDNLANAVTWREQEFLCRLPANEIMQTTACDEILIQGAMDLVAQGDFGIKIIDYKYSQKDDEKLIETYSQQLSLYKKALSRVTGCKESEISAVIVNIYKKRQINLD
ncbi:MAG: UvrD-helicase domain-containing protein [Clostridiales bacterium]|nr:UvrD-helicase domain-containing protein [Clostridiales bacterium]